MRPGWGAPQALSSCEIPRFRYGQQPKLREMILVKFWFWSFWFFLTQRDYAEGQFPAMGFPQCK
jgi:hypothetical protein